MGRVNLLKIRLLQSTCLPKVKKRLGTAIYILKIINNPDCCIFNGRLYCCFQGKVCIEGIKRFIIDPQFKDLRLKNPGRKGTSLKYNYLAKFVP